MNNIVDRLVVSIYNYFNKENKLEEDKELYYHAIKIIIHEWSTYLFLLLISILTNTVIPTIIYIILLTIIRKYSGGYHADTYFMCWFLYTIFYIIFLVLYQTNLFQSTYINLLFLILSSFYIYQNAPVQHVNNPLTVMEKHQYRFYAIIILLVYAGLNLILQLFDCKIDTIILIVLIFNAVLMFLLKHSTTYIED
ncbi:accessory gene regulator B family protein [Anaerorhabdus furcosa]|uniref:Accessory gene regulator protein AgrB n=1 Tax=Anaerorhabdus furcosa TaxID=118967 RepID=A0A1T4PDA7_9FIRM|nr:accessory gene regulator B family protein [Anaerorhabdus furcosa]SJZ89479.1 Accessory gene regulator protein AgrB [Anaerorhabdus furcosa]